MHILGIGDVRIHLVKPKRKGVAEIFTGWTNTAGYHKVVRAIEIGHQWPLLFSEKLKLSGETISKLSSSMSMFSKTGRFTILAKLPGSLVKLREAMHSRAIMASVKEGFGSFTDGVRFFELLKTIGALRCVSGGALARLSSIGLCTKFVSDTAEFGVEFQKLAKDWNTEGKVGDERRNAAYIDIAKKAFAIALDSLILLGMYLGTAIAGPLAMLSISTLEIAMTYFSEFYRGLSTDAQVKNFFSTEKAIA